MAENASMKSTNRAWVGPVVIAFSFVFMAWLSWRKWPDVLVDFGSQLYAPWQIASGAVFYRDISYFPGGPISQYYHALLFKVFGPSLNILLVSNFLILTSLLVVIYRNFKAVSDAFTATMIGLGIVLGFAFSQYLDVGNYNYICPYAHEVMHGLALAIFLVCSLTSWLKTTRRRSLIISGLLFGLIFMTKPDIFLAATLTVGLAFLFSAKARGYVHAGRSLLIFSFCALAPLVLFFFIFFRQETAANSARFVAGAWMPLTTNLVKNNFYQIWLGLDAPWLHLRKMFLSVAGLSGLIGLCLWRLRSGSRSLERLVLLAVSGAVSIYFDWLNCGYVLPFVLCIAVWMRWNLCKQSPQEPSFLTFPSLWFVFSAVLLSKMGFHPRIWHYGVFLAMPAFVTAIYFLFWLLPQVAEKIKTDSRQLRTAMGLLVLIGLIRLVVQSQLYYREKTFSLGPSQDRISTYGVGTDATGASMAEACRWIETNVAPKATLAAIPEGVLLNYLSRHSNPTPHILLAADIPAFGEERPLRAFQERPPDYIFLVHRDTSEYGVTFFGSTKGYGLEMMRWIEANYEFVHLIGQEPLQKSGQFGIKIFKRKAV